MLSDIIYACPCQLALTGFELQLIQKEATDEIKLKIEPAFKKFEDFVMKIYSKKLRKEPGIGSTPEGLELEAVCASQGLKQYVKEAT